MKKSFLFVTAAHFLLCTVAAGQQQKTVPLMPRVNIQADSAGKKDIIDQQWVAVGINRPYSIQHDYSLLFRGKPSYRFELKTSDNALQGYAKGSTKGRAELSYCYATSDNFKDLPGSDYEHARKMKTVYHHGKGITPQGASMRYTFSVFISSSLPENISAIFAQWHGMPSRRLASTPEGQVKMLSVDEFLSLYDRMIFKKNIAHDKITKKNKGGRVTYKAGKPNGWLIEQGGYPPLAFGFSKGYFYIKANSDRKWLTDKTDRCNADPSKTPVMQPVTSRYKASTILYKEPFSDFPKDKWVTFNVDVDWTVYGKETSAIIKPGKIDISMRYTGKEKRIHRHLVDHKEVFIGRNDEDGYYFKFGIYRVGNSTVPVVYNLAGYKETPR
ncbi:heparin lyase I family protein [Sinomicrobium weinanense]|uniref:Heparin lyase I family protein n=1 Tax=Sinomicrobium weinanense TaxID=2842200 RepID=A0A926JV29_9FLAO|nr:heparin lyase I family protein [Sinomicrobium weinanense]MBC9797748.1 heparin lyase I family protein [Sinomicrobium weinanense]MBU3125987.1 polysaccharide lyase [Sinomicrobium weinanense]